MDTRRCSLPLLSMPSLDVPCPEAYEYATPLLTAAELDVTSHSPASASSMTSSNSPADCCDIVQLDVIVHRDGSGYGFSISGDTPVSICHVKPDGPALRAGVCLRDRIVKVNGRHVIGLTHTDVVDHIASSSSVLLTLERTSEDAGSLHQSSLHSKNNTASASSPSVTSGLASGVSRASLLSQSQNSCSVMSLDSHLLANRPLPALPKSEQQQQQQQQKMDKKITAPLPVDDVTRRHWDTKTTHTIRLMLEEQERHLDKLRAQLAVLGTTAAAAGSGQLSAARIRQHVLSAEARRSQLLAKLRQAGASDDCDGDSAAMLSLTSPKSATESNSVPPVPLARASLVSTINTVAPPSLSATRSSSPPPLPQRNRTIPPTTVTASAPIPAARSRLPLPLPNAYASSSHIGPLHPLPATPTSTADKSNSKARPGPFFTTPTSGKATPTSGKATPTSAKATPTAEMDLPPISLLPLHKTPLLTSTPALQTPPALPPRTYRQQSLNDDSTAANEVFPNKTGINALSALSASTSSLLGARVLTSLSPDVSALASGVSNHISSDGKGVLERAVSNTPSGFLNSAGSDGDLANKRRDLHGPRRTAEFGSLSELSSSSTSSTTPRAEMSASCRAASYSQRRDSYTTTSTSTTTTNNNNNNNNSSGNSHRLSSTSPTRSACTLRTPPGTPPPPYVDIDSPTGDSSVNRSSSAVSSVTAALKAPGFDTSNTSNSCCPSPISKSGVAPAPVIMTIEDEDLSEQETSQDECHGAFSSVQKLMSRHAHLAVFMNFVISNCDSSSLFFYMITSLYESGSPKEMRRWAYEIFSSFLLQGATMLVPNMSDTILAKISDTLQNDSDRADKLKSVFSRARREALCDISRQLAAFRAKRTAGLGSMFGPVDHVLDECYHEKGGKMRVVEDVLVRKLENIQNSLGDWDGVDLRDSPAQWLVCCLSTVLYRHFGSRSGPVLTAVDVMPMFVGKERSSKHKLFLQRYRKTIVELGHHLQLHQYNDISYCTVCNDVIRGISPQALQCSHCEMNLHRYCLNSVDEQCVGRRSNDKISKFIDRIRNEPRRRNHPFSSPPSSSSTTPTTSSVHHSSSLDGHHSESNGSGDGAAACSAREQRRVSDVSSSLVTGSGDFWSRDDHGGEVDGSDPAGKLVDSRMEGCGGVSSGSASADRKSTISRSESCRQERDRFSRKKMIRERRKHSDPNIPAKDDEDDVAERLGTNTQSGSSSNSSLSTRFESPSTSMDSVLAVSGSGRAASSSGCSSTAAASAAAAVAAVFGEGCDGWDSDLEAEADPPSWEAYVPCGSARGNRKWSPAERKRLDIVNELFHTERTHVRNLKVLVRVFYRPLLDANILHSNDLHLLFGNVEELLKLHSQFNDSMKERLRQKRLNENIGDLLVSMFEGVNGVNFRTAAAAFCRSQSLALNKLKSLRKRDQNLMTFLAGAESNPVCRRLQLKDILPTAMQRLTKYPLLLGSLLKTVKVDAERALVQRAYDSSCQILAHVNKVKGDTERHERLVEIQSKLDQVSFCRTDHPAVEQIGGRLDLTKYRMIHEGCVQFKFSSKSKHLDLYMLLLEERLIVLLQRQQEDKYFLKFHTVNNTEMNPIIRTDNILVRENAAEKRAIIIINMVSAGPQYYELLFSTSNERDAWYQLIKNAAVKDGVTSGASVKSTGRSHKRTESAHSVLSLSTAADNPPQQQLQQQQQQHQQQQGQGAVNVRSTAVDPASSDVAPKSNAGDSSLAISTQKEAEQQQKEQEQQQQNNDSDIPAPLISPSEMVLTCSDVRTPQSVLTPLERVWRADDQIRRALRQKETILNDLMTRPDSGHSPAPSTEPDEAEEVDQEEDEEDSGQVSTHGLVLQAAVNVNCCVALIVGAISKTRQSLPVPTPSNSGGNSGGSEDGSGGCTQCTSTANSACVSLERLLRMQQRLADTLTRLLGSVEQQQSDRRQLRQLLERVHQLERQLADTVSGDQQQQPVQNDQQQQQQLDQQDLLNQQQQQCLMVDESVGGLSCQIDQQMALPNTECDCEQVAANIGQSDESGNSVAVEESENQQQQQQSVANGGTEKLVSNNETSQCQSQEEQQTVHCETDISDPAVIPLQQANTDLVHEHCEMDSSDASALIHAPSEEVEEQEQEEEVNDTQCQQDKIHDGSNDGSVPGGDVSSSTTEDQNESSTVDVQSSQLTQSSTTSSSAIPITSPSHDTPHVS